MRLPNPRGAVSEWLVDALERRPHAFELALPAYLDDEDLHIALFTCLHVDDLTVDRGWVGHPSVHSLRSSLAAVFAERSAALPVGDSSPLVDHLHRKASLEQFREFAMHRSIAFPTDTRLLTALKLDPTPGAYLQDAPAVTLALRNAATLSATFRAQAERLAAATHRRITEGLRRVGIPTPTPLRPSGPAPSDALHRAFGHHLVDQWSWHATSLHTPAFVL